MTNAIVSTMNQILDAADAAVKKAVTPKEKKEGMKAYLHRKFAVVGKTVTITELIAECPRREGASDDSVLSTLRTAVADLANPKYTGPHKLLYLVRVVKDDAASYKRISAAAHAERQTSKQNAAASNAESAAA